MQVTLKLRARWFLDVLENSLRVLTGIPGWRSPCSELLSADCLTDAMRKILTPLVLQGKWTFTLVDNTGPAVTKAAVIIKPDQFTNNIRTQFLEYQNTTALQYVHAQQFSKLIGQCTVSEISYGMLSQHTRGL